jgi:hypothetical protein
LALEKLNDIDTAKGKPSGIATTIIVIDIIIAFNNSNQSLFFNEKSRFRGLQLGSI